MHGWLTSKQCARDGRHLPRRRGWRMCGCGRGGLPIDQGLCGRLRHARVIPSVAPGRRRRGGAEVNGIEERPPRGGRRRAPSGRWRTGSVAQRPDKCGPRQWPRQSTWLLQGVHAVVGCVAKSERWMPAGPRFPWSAAWVPPRHSDPTGRLIRPCRQRHQTAKVRNASTTADKRDCPSRG
jgi:hypothetical protein